MKRIYLGLILICCILNLGAIIPPEYASYPLQQDPEVISGTLDNGLKYYIKQNAKPEKRLELRLYINAGSIVEDDDQRGLAHFVEHMAFNGTKNFPRTEMVDYLTSIGMGYHNGLNGGTSYDYTVYEFKLPTDDENKMRKGISILSDIAWQVSFEPSEIERERGVIQEEWRLGQSAQQRIQDQIDKVRFAGSRYAERNPIGTIENIKTFKPESLIRYYQDWYRPDLETVFIVGDCDPQKMESLVKEYFGIIPKRENPRPRLSYPVPDNIEPRAVTVLDKEQPYTMLRSTWKVKTAPVTDLISLYNEMKQDLFFTMVNSRLQELSQQPDPSFSYAYMYNTNWLQGFNATDCIMIANEGRSEDAFRTLITELARIRQYGYQSAELERAKQIMIRQAEKWVADKPTMDSEDVIWELLNAVMSGDTIISAEFYEQMLKGLINEIALSEVNDIVDDVITSENLTLSLAGTDKPGANYPSQEELLAIYHQAITQELEPWEDITVNEPLLETIPQPGKINKEKVFPKSGIKQWKLSNGVTIYSKKTDFKADEVILVAQSPGGKAKLKPEDYKAAEIMSQYFNVSGFGNFDAPALQKALAGKIVYVYPTISTYYEGWRGSCSPQDLELMFQLLYQYNYAPRFNEEAFSTAVASTRAWIQNRLLEPSNAFFDTLFVLMFNNHPLKRNLHPEELDSITLKQIKDIFQERFGDYTDFTFYVVGNFDEEQLKNYCQTYLANLPVKGRKEKMTDVGIRAFTGKKEIIFNKGTERSFVSNVTNNKASISPQNNVQQSALQMIAYEKLRENVRENMSGAYVVEIQSSYDYMPEPGIFTFTWMGCNPDRARELNAATFATLDSLKNGLFADKYIESTKTTLHKKYEENIKSNRYWVTNMSENISHNLPIDCFLDYPALYDKLNKKAITKTAKQYYVFDKSLLSVYMFPE
ncbi:MAG TPA: insulinase family protein [Candidatus Cloacimonas sp.]|nr:insulinase family protein [Candidatus Cloacimonas sp.]